MTLPEHTVFLSLGSNIAPEKHLAAAMRLLAERCVIVARSSVYRTPPQGYTEQADFLNMAVQIRTTLTPLTVKTQIIGDIERILRRVRDPHNKNAPRTIDLDIALWDDACLDYGAKPWHIPDPDITRFAHVAVPLAEIAPDYIHPERGESLKAIAARFDASAMQRENLDFEHRYIVAVGGAIWHAGCYLCAVRSQRETVAPGVLSFVSGKVEVLQAPANALEDSLRREIVEETGLRVGTMHYAGSSAFVADDGEPSILVLFLCEYLEGVAAVREPDELESVSWLTPAAILNHPACPPWMAVDLDALERTRRQLGW